MSAPGIVLVTSSFPISNDGSEAAGSFVSDLAEELAKYIPVRVVAPGGSSVREQWSPQVEVFRFAAPAKPLSTLKLWRLTDMLAIARVVRAGKRATREAVQSDATAHILALWALPSGEWARGVARECGVGYSVWMLGSDVWSLGRIPGLRWLLARVIREAANAYADGYLLASDAEGIAGVPVSFLPSTRRTELRDAPPPRTHPPYRLLFLGRWHPNKGIDILLEALAMLEDADWARIECVEIQGGGPLQPLVQDGVAKLRAAGRPVELGGYLVKRDAEAAIARADWVLIPSRIESIPVVFSDAMKLGRPVIATPVGDLPRLIINQRCGQIARAISPAAVAIALQAALSVTQSSFGQPIRDCAAKFDLGTTAIRICNELNHD